MQSVIRLLPENIANQIAAGEVVQRPASVVKELLENAIDAGATKIELQIKEAGKTLIQVSDDGMGMSVQDARLCFERHATSKIKNQDDLFKILTLGFRGEALASIAAVAQVKLKTRLHAEELGTEIEIEASEIKKQEAAVVPPGSLFQVRNLFFNVPARRNFLKSNLVEIRHITNEFIHVALSNCNIHFRFLSDQAEVYDLPKSNLLDRIIAIHGHDFHDRLIYVEETTGYVKMYGYIGRPSLYRKNRGEQYFFVNNRFIKSGLLHNAISDVYQDFLPEKSFPFYCIFFEIAPEHIDINIHPTKTEIKFDDEQTLYALLRSMVNKGLIDIETGLMESGSLMVGPKYSNNLYSNEPSGPRTTSQYWDALYKPYGEEERSGSTHYTQEQPSTIFPIQNPKQEEIVFIAPFQDTYLLAQRNDRLFIIHRQLAHQRILYERYLNVSQNNAHASQQLLFPLTIDLPAKDFNILLASETILSRLGFEIKEMGPHSLVVYGTPVDIPTQKVRSIFDEIISELRESGTTKVSDKLRESVAQAIALRSAVNTTRTLSTQEMKQIVQDLFRCENPAYSPNGKPTFRVISVLDLETYFM